MCLGGCTIRKKVVVLGPSFANYFESFRHGFEQNGYDAHAISYVDPPATPVQRLAWRVLSDFGVAIVPRLELRALRAALKELCRRASFLFVIKSDRIPLDAFSEIVAGAGCPTVLWYMDPVKSIRDGLARAKMCSHLFYFEGTDKPVFESNGIPATHMDLAADTRWYHPNGTGRVDFDVSFVGTFYPERLLLLEYVCASPALKDARIAVWGQYISARRPWGVIEFARTYPHLFRRIKNVHMASHAQINVLNNRSRICLNILRSDATDNLNMRAFETPASGTFQLISDGPAVERCFERGEEVETFSSAEDAVDKVRFYLANSPAREKTARRGYERALKDHTAGVRMREVLARLRNGGLV